MTMVAAAGVDGIVDVFTARHSTGSAAALSTRSAPLGRRRAARGGATLWVWLCTNGG
jgi:hypothetical protein